MKAKLIKSFVTVALLGLAIWAAVSLYHRYLQNPWTRDGQVRANVVGIAPGFPARSSAWGSGTISRHQGDLLFEIDPADFQAQVDVAAGQVQRPPKRTLTQQTQNPRQTELYRTRVNALQDLKRSGQLSGGPAQLGSANWNWPTKPQLHQGRGSGGGYVTNMNTSPGTYVTAGNQLMALVDTSSFWIAGYFKETQLPHIQVGQKARITLMGQEVNPFQAVVRSVGWGISWRMARAARHALLPAVDQTIDWVRLPQRFPVRLQVAGPTPMPLRIGQTVSRDHPEFEPVDAPKAVSCWTV